MPSQRHSRPKTPSPPWPPAAEAALAALAVAPALAELRSSLAAGERLDLTPHRSASGAIEALSLSLGMPWVGDSQCSLLPPSDAPSALQVRSYLLHGGRLFVMAFSSAGVLRELSAFAVYS